jgi:hypothetical protein
MNKWIKILIIALVVIFALSLAKDLIIKVSVEKGVGIVTGLPLKMSGFRAGIINTLVDIKGLVLSNPQGFKDRTMMDAPEIYVRYDLPAVIGGKIHLPEVRINVKEFVVVKNEKGELNLDSLKSIQSQKKGKQAPAGKAPQIQIDSLELKIGKAVYKDYSGGGAPSVMEFPVNINERYTNITDPNTLVALIAFKAMMNTTIASLTNFDIGGLKGTLGNTLAGAQKLAGEAAAQAQAAVTQATQAAQGAAKSAGEAAQKASEGVKNIFGALPFGSEEKK